MGRSGLWTEMLLAPAALLLVLAAAMLGVGALLAGLPLVWLTPVLLRGFAGGLAMDEREQAASLGAERTSLLALLCMVCLLPTVNARGGVLDVLASEWVDVGLLVVAVFYLRVVLLAWWTMDRRMAAHLAGGTAALTLALLTVGTLLVRPSAVAPWVLVAPVLALVPHLVLESRPAVSLGLWIAGTAVAAAVAFGGDFLWIEGLVVLVLLAAPWGAAAAACINLIGTRAVEAAA